MLTKKRLLFSQTRFERRKKIYREHPPKTNNDDNVDKDNNVKDDRGHKDNKDIDIEINSTLLLIFNYFF